MQIPRIMSGLWWTAWLLASLASLNGGSVVAQGDCQFAAEPVRIGVLAPLSAPGAVLSGTQVQWGAEYAAEQLNAACGIQLAGVNHRLELSVGDSEGLPERGQNAVERMIYDDGIHALVGGYHSAVALATMSILQEGQIPTIFANPWNDNVTVNGLLPYESHPPRVSVHENGLDYIFRISPSFSLAVPVVSDWLAEVGVESVVIIAENTDYGVPISLKHQEELAKRGIPADIFHIELGTDDFLPLLSRIYARPQVPGAILVETTGETTLNFTHQMVELGLAPSEDTICIIDEIAYASETYWRTVPDGNYCTFIRDGTIPPLYTALTDQVAAAYFEDFHEEITSYALSSFDALMLMADAIERAGSVTDDEAIVRAIERSDIELTTGRYYFAYGSHNPELEAERAWLWHQWPEPIITVMQYYEEGQRGPDAAVLWPPQYQTHGTTYVEYGEQPPE